MTYEKSADDLEMAGHLHEQLNEAGVAAVRQELKPQTAEGFDGVHCIVCQDDLPAVRIVYGRVRCTSCQCEVERLAKLGRK